MKKIFIMFPCLLLTAWLILFPAGSPASSSDEPKKIAILPFQIHADRDLAFLQEGILDMLASRLAWKDRVEVLEKGVVRAAVSGVEGPLDPDLAIQIGHVLEVDYVILGSLTVFGESVSMDAKILDVGSADILMTAFDQSRGMDMVIPTINQFAEDINAKITGKKTPQMFEAFPSQADRGESALIRSGPESHGGGALRAPSFVQRFKIEIRGLDVGDLTGDGKNEVVLIDKTTVLIYKWGERSLVPFQSLKGSWSPNYVYVSVADLDGNGRSEIYVSNLSSAGADSLVLEWDGAQFKDLMGRQPWLLRVVDLPFRGKTLLGQKRSSEGNYFGDVHTLERKGNSLVSTGALKLPRHANVFNFIQSDLEGKGAVYTVMLDPYEKLNMFNEGGERIWRADEYYGGSLCYMEWMDPRRNDMTDTARRVFLPSPLLFFDINGDGKREVVVCQNQAKDARIFDDFRWFGSGRVLFMAWDGIGLSTEYTSQKLSGTVVGYQIADLNGDGRMNMIVASVTNESYFVGRPQSRVVIYDLD